MTRILVACGLFLLSCGTTRRVPGSTRIGPSGGEIVEAGARLVFPPGSVDADEEVKVDLDDLLPWTPPVLNQKCIAETWNLTSWPTRLRKPVTVVLPFRREDLPHGATAQEIYGVFGRLHLGERIPVDRVDWDRQTVEFRLDGAEPLVAACGRSGSDGLFVTVAVDRRKLKSLEWGPEGDYEILAPDSEEGRTRVFAKLIGPAIPELRKELASRGYAVPDFVRVYLVPMMSQVGGQASGGREIYLNLTDLTEKTVEYAFAHEMFHLVQQVSCKGYETNPKRRDDPRWAEESTADWFASDLYPGSPWVRERILALDSGFGFHSLFTYKETTADAGLFPQPQYLSMIFWSYLDSLYNVDEILQRIYVPPKSPLAQKILSDTADLLGVLDRSLAGTPDARGRKLRLWQVYVNFLIHFLWKKDFEPLRSHFDPQMLGKAGEILAPPKYLERWRIPYEIEGRRILQRRATFAFESFCIVQAIEIASKCRAEEKGDLDLRLKVDESAPGGAAQCLMVAFPIQKGLGSPLYAAPGDPLLIRSWERYAGVRVWLIDASNAGFNDLTLTAKLRKEAEPEPLVDEDLPDKRFVGTWVGKSRVVESDSKTYPVGKTRQDCLIVAFNSEDRLEIQRNLMGMMFTDFGKPSVRVEGSSLVLRYRTADFEYTCALQLEGERQLIGEAREVQVDLGRGTRETVVWERVLQK